MFPAVDPALRLHLAVDRSTAALGSLLDSTEGLLAEPPTSARRAADRGWFRPAEEDETVLWFARFLTVRQGLWEVLAELVAAGDGDLRAFFEAGTQRPSRFWGAPRDRAPADDADGAARRWQAFLLGYGAACGLVHLDRFLLEELATHSLIQRKLNQGFPERRIPRKTFSWIFESFTDPSTALTLDQAIRVRRARWREVRAAAGDPVVAPVLERLAWLEESLDPSRRRFFRLFARFQAHALRRRIATIREHSLFSLLESSGRAAAEIRDGWRPRRLSAAVVDQLAPELRPGDVLITRHENALTNLFLPGFWPHAALYLGDERDRRRLGVELTAERRGRWAGPPRVLEALKDGVLFRPLEETLAVDAAAVIRPALPPAAVAEGLARACRHEGKGYNFDFDFFRSDRLVCTEVVYRAFDGLGGLEIPLRERAGRPTLAAEDLLDLALDGPWFDVVAVFGAPSRPGALLWGDQAIEATRASYRSARDRTAEPAAAASEDAPLER